MIVPCIHPGRREHPECFCRAASGDGRPASPSEQRAHALAEARRFLEKIGYRVKAYDLGDSTIQRYTVTGSPGSALPCQIVALARQRGWQP